MESNNGVSISNQIDVIKNHIKLMVDIPKPVFHSVQNKYVSCDGNFQPALD